MTERTISCAEGDSCTDAGGDRSRCSGTSCGEKQSLCTGDCDDKFRTKSKQEEKTGRERACTGESCVQNNGIRCRGGSCEETNVECLGAACDEAKEATHCKGGSCLQQREAECDGESCDQGLDRCEGEDCQDDVKDCEKEDSCETEKKDCRPVNDCEGPTGQKRSCNTFRCEGEEFHDTILFLTKIIQKIFLRIIFPTFIYIYISFFNN